jgi:hypothetical protein
VQNTAPDLNGDTLACYELLPAHAPDLYRMVLRERRMRGNQQWRHSNRRTCEWAVYLRQRRINAVQFLGSDDSRALRWERIYSTTTDFSDEQAILCSLCFSKFFTIPLLSAHEKSCSSNQSSSLALNFYAYLLPILCMLQLFVHAPLYQYGRDLHHKYDQQVGITTLFIWNLFFFAISLLGRAGVKKFNIRQLLIIYSLLICLNALFLILYKISLKCSKLGTSILYLSPGDLFYSLTA